MPLAFLLLQAEAGIKTVESVTMFRDNGKLKDPQVELVFRIRDIRPDELEPRVARSLHVRQGERNFLMEHRRIIGRL